MTNLNGTFNAHARDAKLVLSFITLRKYQDQRDPLRSLITDHFTCSAADVSYCITYTYCKKVFIGETGRRLGNRFWEHHDVDRNDKDASKPIADTLISLLILSSIWQFAAFPHIQAVRKASNSFTKLIFQIGTLNPHGINERFSFD